MAIEEIYVGPFAILFLFCGPIDDDRPSLVPIAQMGAETLTYCGERLRAMQTRAAERPREL